MKNFMEMDLDKLDESKELSDEFDTGLDFDFDEAVDGDSPDTADDADNSVNNNNNTSPVSIDTGDDFWYKSTTSGSYDNKPATDEEISNAEREIGYKLPSAYKELIKQHNGGRVKKCICPTDTKTGWANDHLEITSIYGINKNKPSIFQTKFYEEEWGYPEIGIVIADTPTAGHTMVFLDYRECGNEGEPSVVEIDQENNYTITKVADNFKEFIDKLITEDEFKKNENNKTDTTENATSDDEIPEIPEPTQEGYVQEGMFDAGFGNLRSKIANALGEKFKVTNVIKGMGGKDKFDISEADGEPDTKTTVESTGTGCKVVSRGDGKFKCNFTNIPLSAAFEKILDLFKQPELLLEGAFYNISRNGGKLYQEADEEETEEDLNIPEELDLDDEDTKEEPKGEETSEEEPKTDDEEDVEIDIEKFGSDDSDVQNDYDQKDVDSLNKLVAAESEAINDYFDASKDTKDENLRTLFSDIGHEERFHLEQLLYAKSIITGEKYEPRDPEVKAEYEELINGGMDEDTAASTAIDKVTLNSGDEVDPEEIEQEAAYIYDNLYHNEIFTEYCVHKINEKIAKNAIMTAHDKFITEAFIQESLDNVATANRKDIKIKSPIDYLIKGLTLSVNGIAAMGKVVRDSLHKNNLKNARRKEWIKKHGIAELFKSGVALYFYVDRQGAEGYDLDTPARYVDMLYRLSKDIGKRCGVNLSREAKRGAIQNPIKYRDVADGMNILRGVVLTKTKVVVNEHNRGILEQTFFGYTPQKTGVAVTHGKDQAPVNDSANIYNRLDVVLAITKEYADISNAVLGALKQLQGNPNSVFYKNRKLYDQSVKDMEIIVKKYQEFISCMAHDLKVMVKIDSGMLKQTRERDMAEQNGTKENVNK